MYCIHIVSNLSVVLSFSCLRIFRRRRRPRSSLVSLLSDVTESCQLWFDEKVFGGVFKTNQTKKLNLDQGPNSDFGRESQSWEQDQDKDWSRTNLGESMWTGMNSTELDDRCSFIFDPTEAPPPPDKQPLVQEKVCSEICQSQETFSQSLGGLSEVLPTMAFHTQTCCCQSFRENTGLTINGRLLFSFTIFIMTALYSRCLWLSTAVASTVFVTVSTLMILTKSGPMGEWRKAKTEDITSRNE